MGYAPHESLMQHFRIVEGRGLAGNRELIIGRLAADAIKVHVGSVVRLAEVAFRVVGLFETGTSWEESISVIALRDAQALYGKPHQVTFYSIKLTDPQQADRVIKAIKVQFPDLLVARSSEFTESLPDFQSMSGLMFVSPYNRRGGLAAEYNDHDGVRAYPRDCTLRALGCGGRVLATDQRVIGHQPGGPDRLAVGSGLILCCSNRCLAACRDHVYLAYCCEP
jgi:hypothetical protein